MPSGTGAITAVNDPSAQALPFVTDPVSFFELTEKNVRTAFTDDSLGLGGGQINRQLPQAGVLSKLKIMFEGTLTTTLGAGTVTGAARYPHGLIEQIEISVNVGGKAISLNGTDLHAIRQVNHPGVADADTVTTFPGVLGAGAIVPDGANDLVLIWECPIAIDPTTLIGAVYAQSPAMNLQLRLDQADADDELVVAAGGGAVDSLTGSWSVQVTSFEIPFTSGENPALVVPDVSRLHSVQAHPDNFSALGAIRSELVRGNGQLDRLLVQYASGNPATDTSADAFYRADPDLDEIDRIRLEYGNAERPLDYEPAGFLAVENAEHYDDRLDYGYLCFDLLAENPPRDIIQMQGVTDLVVIADLNTGAAAPAAGAHARLVQEMLVG